MSTRPQLVLGKGHAGLWQHVGTSPILPSRIISFYIRQTEGVGSLSYQSIRPCCQQHFKRVKLKYGFVIRKKWGTSNIDISQHHH